MRKYQAHVGSWENPTETIIINVPDYDSGTYFDSPNGTINSISAQYPAFDPDYTWFVLTENTYGYMQSLGFSDDNLIQMYFYTSSTQPLYLYFSSDHYIRLQETSATNVNYTYHYNGTNKNGNFGGTYQYATTLLTIDITNTNNRQHLSLYNLNTSRFRCITSQITGDSDANNWFYQFWDSIPEYDDTDPYLPGGTTDEGGGTGTFDDTSDTIPVPDLPTVTVTDTGFISLYTPTLAQLKSLATYLWDSNGLDLDTFKRVFSDPISAILGLSLVPINPGAGTSASVILGNIDTGVTMPRVQDQFIRFSCGSLTIEEYWGGYLDYSPYTRAEIYLPFIGAKPLNIDDIMGKTVTLWYLFDVLSGGCVACLECGGSILYQFMGECACSIPITGRDLTNVINGLLTVVGAGVGAMVATGGAMAAAGAASAAGIVGAGAAAAAGSLARNVTGMKTYVEKSGSMGGMGGMLGVKTPYIILTRPRQALPANQNTYTGYPSYITTLLGDCSGFTVVQDVHLEGLTATEEEKAEIGRLLREGVYL